MRRRDGRLPSRFVHDDVVPPPSTSEWRISPGIGTPGSAGANA